MDDEPAFTRLVRLTLAEFDIREENQPELVLTAVQEFDPDVILLDVIMPGIDGGELAAKIRAMPGFATLPIIFITAIVSAAEAATRKSLGGFPYLPKPVTEEKLRACLAEYLPESAGGSALGGLSRGLVDGAKRLAGFFRGDTT